MANKAFLNALSSVLISWGDVDLTVPAWVAWRIRSKLSISALNPQPLPPVAGPHPEP